MSISDDITKAQQDLSDGIDFMRDEIISLDAKKEVYDSAIEVLEEPLLPELNEVNQTLADVQAAYEARHTANCRTDLFWRLTGINTEEASPAGGIATAIYQLQVTKLSLTGYGVTSGVQGSNLTVVDVSGGITTYSSSSHYGYIKDNLHGLKYYDEPLTRDIGDTTVGNFIGTVGTGSTVLAIMAPYSDNLVDDFTVDQLVSSDKSGIFATNNTIVGFSSVVTTLPDTISGIGTTTVSVPTILLETAASGTAASPESDGSFVVFNVIDDPAGITTWTDYAITMGSNPFSPQTLGIIKENTLGVGVSIYYDNSGLSSSKQSWRPEYAISGYAPDIPDVVEPAVGAGPIYYKEGFTNKPNQGEGTTKQTKILNSGLFTALGSCSTEQAALTAAINARNAAESGFPSAAFTAKLSASRALRTERREKYQLPIHGQRQAIGEFASEKGRYDDLQNYVDTEGV